MSAAYVAGVGMTRFAKAPDSTLKTLARAAVQDALDDAGLTVSEIEAAYCSNATAGLITGQEMIRGQVELRPLGFSGIPIVNVENACASGSTAIHLAWQAIAGGMHDCVLVLGVEKLTHEDKSRTFSAIGTAIDVEARAEIEARLGGNGGDSRSFFMDLYAANARRYMDEANATREDFARVAVKNHGNGTRNPRAQYGGDLTASDVLDSREVVWPLTLLMCCPISDGAAAAVLVSERHKARRAPFVRIEASILGSAVRAPERPYSAARNAAATAYEKASLGPGDLDLIELHDGTAAAELMLYEVLGLVPDGEGARLLAEGATELGGRIPVNPSGGLLSKGHPIGATGIAQIAELTWQLRAEAGERQVEDARIGLAQNGGGWLEGDSAATSVHILARS